LGFYFSVYFFLDSGSFPFDLLQQATPGAVISQARAGTQVTGKNQNWGDTEAALGT
jgi:hypothetical protein